MAEKSISCFFPENGAKIWFQFASAFVCSSVAVPCIRLGLSGLPYSQLFHGSLNALSNTFGAGLVVYPWYIGFRHEIPVQQFKNIFLVNAALIGAMTFLRNWFIPDNVLLRYVAMSNEYRISACIYGLTFFVCLFIGVPSICRKKGRSASSYIYHWAAVPMVAGFFIVLAHRENFYGRQFEEVSYLFFIAFLFGGAVGILDAKSKFHGDPGYCFLVGLIPIVFPSAAGAAMVGFFEKAKDDPIYQLAVAGSWAAMMFALFYLMIYLSSKISKDEDSLQLTFSMQFCDDIYNSLMFFKAEFGGLVFWAMILTKAMLIVFRDSTIMDHLILRLQKPMTRKEEKVFWAEADRIAEQNMVSEFVSTVTMMLCLWFDDIYNFFGAGTPSITFGMSRDEVWGAKKAYAMMFSQILITHLMIWGMKPYLSKFRFTRCRTVIVGNAATACDKESSRNGNFKKLIKAVPQKYGIETPKTPSKRPLLAQDEDEAQQCSDFFQPRSPKGGGTGKFKKTETSSSVLLPQSGVERSVQHSPPKHMITNADEAVCKNLFGSNNYVGNGTREGEVCTGQQLEKMGLPATTMNMKTGGLDRSNVLPWAATKGGSGNGKQELVQHEGEKEHEDPIGKRLTEAFELSLTRQSGKLRLSGVSLSRPSTLSRQAVTQRLSVFWVTKRKHIDAKYMVCTISFMTMNALWNIIFGRARIAAGIQSYY